MEKAYNTVIDLSLVRRDSYFAMALLLADREIVKVKSIDDWTQLFYEGEVRRLILLVATAGRSLLDGFSRTRPISKENCGEYWVNFPNGSQSPLEFRQACNSLIHAREILLYTVPELDLTERVRNRYIDRITVRGVHRNHNTNARIDVVRFANLIADLTRICEEENHVNI